MHGFIPYFFNRQCHILGKPVFNAYYIYIYAHIMACALLIMSLFGF